MRQQAGRRRRHDARTICGSDRHVGGAQPAARGGGVGGEHGEHNDDDGSWHQLDVVAMGEGGAGAGEGVGVGDRSAGCGGARAQAAGGVTVASLVRSCVVFGARVSGWLPPPMALEAVCARETTVEGKNA